MENKESKAQEVVTVNQRNVKCNGNGGTLGHPLIYLEIDKDDFVVCPYCSKKFIYQAKK